MTRALPETITPHELAEQIGCSERRVRELARGLGACRVLGNRMFFLPQDVDAILEAMRPCPSKSTNAAIFGTTGERLPVGDYAALVKQRQKQPLRKSPPRSKAGSSNVVSMAHRQS